MSDFRKITKTLTKVTFFMVLDIFLTTSDLLHWKKSFHNFDTLINCLKMAV